MRGTSWTFALAAACTLSACGGEKAENLVGATEVVATENSAISDTMVTRIDTPAPPLPAVKEARAAAPTTVEANSVVEGEPSTEPTAEASAAEPQGNTL